MAAIDDLRALAPPPADPPPPPDWDAAPSPLPDDYVILATEWGPGVFDDFLWLLVPGAENENLDLLVQIDRQRDALRTVAAGGEPMPYDIDDLLPWGITDNGDVAYWDTRTWTVAVNEGRGPEWHLFDGGAAAFLVAFLSGRERVSVFPDDVPSETPGFSR